MAASKVPPFGVNNPAIGIEGRLLGTARIVNAVGRGKRIDIVVIKVEIALQFAQLCRLRNSCERIFAGDFGQRQRRIYQLLQAFRGQIAGVGAGSTLSEENSHSNGLRSGLLERFYFAQTHDRGEFAAVHGHGFRGGGSALHGAADNIVGNFLQIGRAGLGSDFAFLGRCIHKITIGSLKSHFVGHQK